MMQETVFPSWVSYQALISNTGMVESSFNVPEFKVFVQLMFTFTDAVSYDTIPVLKYPTFVIFLNLVYRSCAHQRNIK
jgi:hypothetical protein